MRAHHFIGVGAYSRDLRAVCNDEERLLAAVADQVRAGGLSVVAERAVPFPGGGSTLVWILAESHLVMHLWPEHDRATFDLHICDYTGENTWRARQVRDALDELCFAPGSSAWRELAVGDHSDHSFDGTLATHVGGC